MDQKFKFGGTIGYGDSYLEVWFRHFKVFRLHAILYDAAEAVRAHSGRGPDYCHVIGQGQNSYFLGHVTGLLFCLYVKLFLPSNSKSVDLWSSMSCIVLGIELTDKNVINELEISIDVKVLGYSFCPPKNEPTKQAFWCTPNLHGKLCNNGHLITVSFQTFFPELWRINTLQKEQKNARFSAI